jgi:Gluconate 2-dehydrogenase subunit 3
MSGIRRRDAIRLLGGAPLAMTFALSGAEAAEAHAHARKALAAAAKGQAYKPQFFTLHEWETVRILVDLILPKDERSGSATDAGVPEFMDFIMTDPMESDRGLESRQTAMRGGLAWIDAECVKRFGHELSSCAAGERTTLLDDIAFSGEGGDDDRQSPRDLRVHLRAGASFFASFRDLTASGFWSSRMGVEDLGYQGNTFVAEWKGCPPEALRKLGLEP